VSGPESREQAKILRLFDAVGFVVIPTSEGRRVWRPSGLPDLWCTHPELGVCFWFEVKGPKGRVSPTQEAFVALTEVAGLASSEATVPRCYIGQYADAERLVVRLGLATVADDGKLTGLTPKRGAAYHAWHRAQALRKIGTQAKRARAKVKTKAGAPRSRLEVVHPLMRKDIADWLAKGVPQRDIMQHFRVSRYAVKAFAADLKRAA
jgi:hypothetical protein